jgi:uncharacterized protein YukE
MYSTKADDLTRMANDLDQLAKKYNEAVQQLDQQRVGLDGVTQQLIAGGPDHWLGISSEAFQGAWEERRARMQQVSLILSQSAQHFTQFAQIIEENLSTIRADQALQQGPPNHILSTDDRVSILDEESQAQNAIITALATINSQLEALAEEVADCPEEQNDPIYGTNLGKDGISKNDTNSGSENGLVGKEDGAPDAAPVDVKDLDPQQTRSEAYEALEALNQELENHPELKGEYITEYNNLVADYKEASEIVNDPETDPELATLAHETIFDLKGRASEITGQIQGRYPLDIAQEPAYILENRVPLDSETILSDSNRFERTTMNVKGAVVYRDKETGLYYHRDTLHKGAGAEIEVYGPDGTHRGTITPDGANKGGPVPGRRLPK